MALRGIVVVVVLQMFSARLCWHEIELKRTKTRDWGVPDPPSELPECVLPRPISAASAACCAVVVIVVRV